MQQNLIELHCHSNFSDGVYPPKVLALMFADLKISYAALTDHDTLGGLEDFESVCEKHGIGFISGVELTIEHNLVMFHLLCYGFDRHDKNLIELVTALGERYRSPETTYITKRRISLQDLLDTVHSAGGVVSLAHPIHVESELDKLELFIEELANAGLDAIEVAHPSANREEQDWLSTIAIKYNLLTTFGTDFHGTKDEANKEPGLTPEPHIWHLFKQKLINNKDTTIIERKTEESEKEKTRTPILTPLKNNIYLSMILPATASFLLFAVTLFGYFLPRFENSLMDKKKEMIRELTDTVHSLLVQSEKKIQEENLDRLTVQKQVAEQIRFLRYGKQSKDYFWIQDTTPTMIMHPYRPDLEGNILTNFSDPKGVKIFVIFANTAKEYKEGYVDYFWQWKDDPGKIEAKESFVKIFEPWGWVIGTGIYIHDVTLEISLIEREIVIVMAIIVLLLILLLSIMLRNGLCAESQRRKTEKILFESNDRYAALVRLAGEGVLMLRKNRSIYANPIFLKMSGYELAHLPLIDLPELFPTLDLNTINDTNTERLQFNNVPLQRKDNLTIEVDITLKDLQTNNENKVLFVKRSNSNNVSNDNEQGELLKKILNLPSVAAQDLAKEIADSETEEAVIKLCKKIYSIVPSALETGASSLAIASMITTVSDAAAIKFIELTQLKIGPSPVPFVFACLGSQGRCEQTLFTDQDNAILFDSDLSEKADAYKLIQSYFLKLAEIVVENLSLSGYTKCKGFVMASNPRWCQSLAVWKSRFHEWVNHPGSEEMMDLGTYFDMRPIFGSKHLVDELRDYNHSIVKETPWLLTQIAKDALAFKSPLRMFGQIPAILDLKVVMIPIISFARLYALQNQIVANPTSERLSNLKEKGVILPINHHNLITTYEVLMRLRLRHQIEMLQQNSQLSNEIETTWLGHMDEAMLRECFKEIDLLQDSICRNFFGEKGNL